MDRMYQETIMDYARHPRNFGRVAAPDVTYEDHNPLCGDQVRVELKLDPDGRIAEARFSGRGCAISQAAASMLMESIEGKTLDEVRQIGRQEVLDLLGIPISMARMKCAMLGLKVLKAGAYGLGGWPGEDEDEAWPSTSR
ncbi:MAG: SUF system NifU family Fe-S cluster assembly protein [Chloroflexi bacterium]|nr:SUF system NifU family Fe-S cluster assembly protein [Chloroflexota bacterium]